MTRYVALLSAVNLGSHRRIAMTELRALLAGLGYSDVSTHLQSGNAVLTAADRPTDRISAEIGDRIAGEHGMDVDVVVRTAEELHDVLDRVPLDVGDPTRFLVLFLSRAPDRDRLADIDTVPFAPEEMGVGQRELYFRLPNGVRNARLPSLAQKRLQVPATARNWNTVTRLCELTRG